MVASASGLFSACRRGAQSGLCSGLTPLPGSPDISHIYHIIEQPPESCLHLGFHVPMIFYYFHRPK